MNTITRDRVGPVRIAGDLKLADLRHALAAGWRDYRAHPAYGLFFSAIYVALGLFLYVVLVRRGEVFWVIPAVAGFPLLAPFAAAGLYEVSRRREHGLPLSWGVVLGAVRSGDGQLPVMGMIAFVLFSFWVILAHAIFGLFLGQNGLGSQPLEVLLSPAGLSMLLVGGLVGGVVALVLFMMTVVSLPLLVDREVDFITAIVASIRAVTSNGFTMLFWAALIAVLLFAAMLPLLLGLFLVLPVLGHATWHLYRRTVASAEG